MTNAALPDLRALARARLANQRLIGRGFASPAEAVRWFGAVQAQDYAGAKWAVGQRSVGAVDADVETALRDGRILRTHVLRPTWHFVAPDDIRWMLTLTSPRIRATMAYADRQLGLTARLIARSNEALARALEGGRHLTREELGQALARVGIDASGQRLGHLVGRAELDLVMCSGPRRGKQFTYASFEERAPQARDLPRDEALGELTVRYFRAHGPALPQDFAWWSGLTVADAKRGLQLAGDRLAATSLAGRSYWHGIDDPVAGRRPRVGQEVVHLLPNYDELLIAYRERDAVVDTSVLRKLRGGNGVFASHFLTLDGRLAGVWRRLLEKKTLIVEVQLVAKPGPRLKRPLLEAARRLSVFLGQPVRVRHVARGGLGARTGSPGLD